MRRIEEKRAETIRRLLLAAYDAGKRDLPWRGETDPYRIWVSEIMLQQTRVETVIPYYEKWLRRFPDLDTLAGAEEDDVLRIWQGLGYYSRARRLLEGARVVRERLAGHLPDSAQGLRELPGVGEYTAGAVASIAFGEAVPAVDGNVKRVLSRLFDLEAPGPAEYRGLAEGLVDPARPGDFNQALMELGALVCIPRNPKCEACPLAGECLALTRGTVEDRPAKMARKPVPEVDLAVVVAVAGAEGVGDSEVAGDRPRFLVQKRPETGLLAGMWEFPGAEVEGMGSSATPLRVAAEELASHLGIPATGRTQPLVPVTHLFSHLKARYHPFLMACGVVGGNRSSRDGTRAAPDPGTAQETGASLDGGAPPPSTPVWRSLDELAALPLPVAQGKILVLAREHLGI
jgi:A/G-specific adenine glycosylase